MEISNVSGAFHRTYSDIPAMGLQLHLATEEMSNHRLFKFTSHAIITGRQRDVELGGGGTLLLGTEADAVMPTIPYRLEHWRTPHHGADPRSTYNTLTGDGIAEEDQRRMDHSRRSPPLRWPRPWLACGRAAALVCCGAGDRSCPGRHASVCLHPGHRDGSLRRR